MPQTCNSCQITKTRNIITLHKKSWKEKERKRDQRNIEYRKLLTGRHGSNAVRLYDNCSIFIVGGSLFPIPTDAIFTGSPDVIKLYNI